MFAGYFWDRARYISNTAAFEIRSNNGRGAITAAAVSLAQAGRPLSIAPRVFCAVGDWSYRAYSRTCFYVVANESSSRQLLFRFNYAPAVAADAIVVASHCTVHIELTTRSSAAAAVRPLVANINCLKILRS